MRKKDETIQTSKERHSSNKTKGKEKKRKKTPKKPKKTKTLNRS